MTFPLDSTVPGSLLQNFELCLKQMPERLRPDLDFVLFVLKDAKPALNLYIGSDREFTRCVKLLNGGRMPDQRSGETYRRTIELAYVLGSVSLHSRDLASLSSPLKLNLCDAISNRSEVPDLKDIVRSVHFFLNAASMGSRIWNVWQRFFDQYYPVANRTLEEQCAIQAFSCSCKAGCLKAGPMSDQIVQKFFHSIAWKKALICLDRLDSQDAQLAEIVKINPRLEQNLECDRTGFLYDAIEFLKIRDFVHSLLETHCELTKKLITELNFDNSPPCLGENNLTGIANLAKFDDQYRQSCLELSSLLANELPKPDMFISERRTFSRMLEQQLMKIQALHDKCESLMFSSGVSTEIANHFRRNQSINLLKVNLLLFSSHFKDLMFHLRDCLMCSSPSDQGLSDLFSALIPPNQPELVMSFAGDESRKYYCEMLSSLARAKAYFDKSQPLAKTLKRDLGRRAEGLKSWCNANLLSELKQKEQARDQYREFLTSTHYFFVPARAMRTYFSMRNETSAADLVEDDQSIWGNSPWCAVDRGISFPEPKTNRAHLSQLNFPYVPSQAKWFNVKPPLNEERFPECQHQSIERQTERIFARSLFPVVDHYVDRGFSYSLTLGDSQSVEIKFLCATIQKDRIENDGVFAWGLHGGQTCFYRKFIPLKCKRPFESIQRIDRVLRDIKSLASEIDEGDLQSSAKVRLEDRMEYAIAIDELRARVHLTSPQAPDLAVTIHSYSG